MQEKVIEVPLTMEFDRRTTEAVKERVARYFSSVRMGRFSVGAPKPEDVKIVKKNLKYVPFWRVQATYACRYVRRGSYRLKIPRDVEEVKVYGKLQQVVGQRRRLSDLVAAVGTSSGVGYGPVRVSLTSLEGAMKSGVQNVLGSKDKDMGRLAELTISDAEELASFAQSVRLCFNANLGGEDKKMFHALENVSSFDPLSKSARRHCVSVLFDKEEVIKKTKKVAVRRPDISPSRIVEHELALNRLELVYVPFYDLTVEAKGQRKTIKLNALTNEDYKL
ncbi:MAG: hypothetical protein ABSG45_04745 [Nitrososphaerales archaeon]